MVGGRGCAEWEKMKSIFLILQCGASYGGLPEKHLRVLEIDEDMTVLLQGDDGLCTSTRFPVPHSVVLKDVQEAIQQNRYVEAHLIGHVDTCRPLQGVICSIRIYAYG